MKTTTTPYDVAEHLRTPEEMAAYLEACIEEADGMLPSLLRLWATSHGPRG
jgi:DNA-binding phage protein